MPLNPCVCFSTERVVIRQTPHNEGEEHENHEEEELSSGSSRGSVQWVSAISHEQAQACELQSKNANTIKEITMILIEL